MASSPPRWEIGLYAAGALALLGIAAINLWKLWRSGSYPAPSPFPNYDYRYLEQKYGAACPDIRNKVRGILLRPSLFLRSTRDAGGLGISPGSPRRGEQPQAATWCCWSFLGDGWSWELREAPGPLPRQLEARQGPGCIQGGAGEAQLSGPGWEGWMDSRACFPSPGSEGWPRARSGRQVGAPRPARAA